MAWRGRGRSYGKGKGYGRGGKGKGRGRGRGEGRGEGRGRGAGRGKGPSEGKGGEDGHCVTLHNLSYDTKRYDLKEHVKTLLDGGFGRVDLQTKPDGTSTGRARVGFRFLKDAEAAAKALHDFSFFTLTSFAFAFRRRGVLEMGWGLPPSCLRIPFRFQPYSIDAHLKSKNAT